MQRRDRYAEALACYDQAIAADPTHVDGHCNRGTLLAMDGRYEEALASLQDRRLFVAASYLQAQPSRRKPGLGWFRFLFLIR